MRIFISADIEGVAGVVVPAHGQAGNPEYERARRLMTAEVNAAIGGAFAGGAEAVLVADSHGPMINLLPEELDPRAELIQGKPRPMSMFCGVESGFDGVFCTGYHAGAGHRGVLSHTTSGVTFAEIAVNGLPLAEAMVYGAYAGELGVPVVMLSGDDQLAEQCRPHFPGAEFAVVKTALGHRATRALSPERARQAIHAAALAAARGLADGSGGCKPFVISAPCRAEFTFNTIALADVASIIPVAERCGPRSVAFQAGSMREVVGWMNTLSAMSAMLR